MSVIYFVILLILVFSLGLSLALWLKLRSWLEIWGVSWLLGMGWGSMLWFLSYFFLNQPFSLESIFTVLVVSNLVSWSPLWLLQRHHLKERYINFQVSIKSFSLSHLSSNTVVWWCFLLLVLIFGFVVFQDIFWPVTDWDALALYDFRAKVIVATGSMAQGKELDYFFQYPLFTSALHAWTYFTGMGVAKIWYALIYQAALVTFYVVLRRKAVPEIAAIGTLFFATSPLIFAHSFTAYTNLSYTVFASLGFIYLWQWWDTPKIAYLLLGSMFVGLSTWVRISEPFYFVALLIIIAGVIKQSRQKKISLPLILSALLASGFVLLTRYPWDALITSLYGTNVNTPTASFSLMQSWTPLALVFRSREVITYLWAHSAPVFFWYALLAFGLFIIDLKNKRWQVLCGWITMALLLGTVFAGTIILSFSLESWNRIGDSVARMSIFMIPLWIYLIFASPSWKNITRKSS